MNDLQSHFNQKLKSRSGRVKRWVIGLSGGLDSVVLLHLAARSVPADQLLVVNIDHQLQAQSAHWSEFCSRLAALLKLPCLSQKVIVNDDASLEQAARSARYRVFESILQPGDCLLLAHHLDDQAETMLFRLLRGAGVRGLAGIPEYRVLGQGELFRPLLNIPRQQLLDWAEVQRLEWIDDPSNTDLTYDRNYLRHQVLPVLQRRWPGFAERWSDTAAYMREAEQLQSDLARIDFETVSVKGGLACQALMALSQPRRNNLLRFWLLTIGFSVGERQIRSIIGLIRAADDRQPMLELGEYQLRRYQGILMIQPAPSIINWGNRPLTDAGEQTDEGCLYVSHAVNAIALKTLSGVTIRNRLDGDRCKPVGRRGSCSLKKLFQEHKVPVWQRSSWPVCVVADEIVAVPGVCICEGWQSEKKGSGFALKWLPIALSVTGDSDTL